jgi:hypothetical protein
MRGVSYAVVWRENGGPACAGGLVLVGAGLELSGATTRRDVPYADLRELYVDRSEHPALVLVTSAGDSYAISSLQGLGALHELADRVAVARAGPGS